MVSEIFQVKIGYWLPNPDKQLIHANITFQFYRIF